ncbi:MAG: hypothetical protein EOM26_12385 [Alphaproteobacteria bacterium]|nr:hypothetical protein [Alphaproteobacteria bacterium]
MKKLVKFLLVTTTLSLPLGAVAAPWAIVATQFNNTTECEEGLVDCRDGIYTIDLGYLQPKVYGPFLQDQIDQENDPPTVPPSYSTRQVLDIAVRPWSKEVLVSLFYTKEILRIDVGNPTSPKLTGRLKLEYETGLVDESEQPVIYSLFAEDISISPDGKTAVISDGGFSPYLAFIDLKRFKLTNIQKLEYDNLFIPGEKIEYYAQANAIAPDNKTVLFVDYFGSAIYYGKLNQSRDALVGITRISSCSQPDLSDPGNCLGLRGYSVFIYQT